MKKQAPFNRDMVIRGAIRRTFARAPIKQEILREGRREVPKYRKDGSLAAKPAVQYHCAVCLNWVPSTSIAVDHIVPVIDPEVGFVSWETFVDRLYCDKSNLQRICSPCHNSKTQAENLQRRISKDTEKINELEKEIGSKKVSKAALKKSLAKFSSKVLAQYPTDLSYRINRLKEFAKAKS